MYINTDQVLNEGCCISAGTNGLYADDPFWKELLQFHEFFDAETGRGCGARQDAKNLY